MTKEAKPSQKTIGKTEQPNDDTQVLATLLKTCQMSRVEQTHKVEEVGNCCGIRVMLMMTTLWCAAVRVFFWMTAWVAPTLRFMMKLGVSVVGREKQN